MEVDGRRFCGGFWGPAVNFPGCSFIRILHFKQGFVWHMYACMCVHILCINARMMYYYKDSRHTYIYIYMYIHCIYIYIYLLHVYTTYILQHIKYHQINKCKLIYLQCGSLIHHFSIISSTLACKRLCGFLKGLSQIVGTTVDGWNPAITSWGW